MNRFPPLSFILLSALLAACPQPSSSDAGAPSDAAVANVNDAGMHTMPDAGTVPDAAQHALDAAAPADAATRDAAMPDASVFTFDAAVAPDAALPEDAGSPDAGRSVRQGCPVDPAIPAFVTAESNGHTFRVAAPNVTLRLQVLDDHVVRMDYLGGLPATPPRGWAVVDESGLVSQLMTGTQPDGAFALCTPQVMVEVNADGRVRATDALGTLLANEPAGSGYSEDALSGQRQLVRSVQPSEAFYGLGERTGPLNKRGRVYTFWNTDAYISSAGGYPPDADPLYQSVPLLIGVQGQRAYGVFTDNTHRLQLDLASSATDRWTLTAHGGTVTQYLIAGPQMSDVVTRYSKLTGRMPLPPMWSLGYQQCRWGYSPDARVQQVMQEFRSRGLPADGIWLDIQHMRGFRSFTFDPVSFSNPAALISTAESLGFKTVTIVDPGIKEDSAWDIYQQGDEGNHYLTQPNGDVYVGSVWPGASVFPDFTRAATRDWWATLVARNVALGVRGLWIDMNEPSNFTGLPGGTVPDTLRADGEGFPTTLAEVHNVYGFQMARATFQGMQTAAPNRRPFVLTRAGYAGGQRYAAVWTGDAPSSWDTLRGTLPMMLNMGLSGMAFIGSDVGGYSGGPSPELFARWMQLGSISPFFRGHVAENTPDQEPWSFGVEVEYISKQVMRERYRLLPYLYGLFHHASVAGTPILRAMPFEFPAAQSADDQAMLGPWLLYAPVLTAGATERTVQLPPGRWMEDRSGALYDGGGTITVPVTLESLPVFVRPGAIIPRGSAVTRTEEQVSGPLTLDVYPSTQATSFALYEDDGDSRAHEGGAFHRVVYSQLRTGERTRVEALAPEGSLTPTPRRMVVRVRPVDSAPSTLTLDGVPVAAAANAATLHVGDPAWLWDATDRAVLISFADHAPFTLDLEHADATVLRPTVLVPVEVLIPAGTPLNQPIHIATSASGWQHQPLTWAPTMDRAFGNVEVPRGEWFLYKYTRGGWPTVEKWAGCLEATNRYAFGAAHPGKQDRVDVWADGCP